MLFSPACSTSDLQEAISEETKVGELDHNKGISSSTQRRLPAPKF